MYPERFCNVTNGVTPRRFIALSNPGLAALITDRLGDAWLRHLEDAARPRAAGRRTPRSATPGSTSKHLNKLCLAHLLHERTGVAVDPSRTLRRAGQAHSTNTSDST